MTEVTKSATSLSAVSFDDLWQSVIDKPIRDLEIGEDEESGPSADGLSSWLRRIADESLSAGLIETEQHDEAATCIETLRSVLGTVEPDSFRAILRKVNDEDV